MNLFQGDAPTPVELESSAVQSAPQYLTNYLTQLASAGTQALGTPTYDAEGKITGVTPSTSASLITPMSALQQGAYIGAGGTPTYNAQGQIIGYTGSPLTSYTGALTNAASAFDRQPVTSEDITGFLNPERATGYESTLSKAIEALQPSVTASDVTKLLDPNRATTYEPIFEKSLSALSPLTAQERINAFYKPFTSQSETGGLGLRSFDEAQRAFQRQPVSQSDIRAFYNPYEQSVVDEMAKQSAINYQRNVLPSLKAGFDGQGDLGSRRYSNVLGQTAADIQSNLLAQQAKARSQGYETALEAALKEAGYDIQSGVGLTSLGKAEQEGYKTALEAALKESQTDVSKAQALTNLGAEERRSFSDALRSALELEQLGVTGGTGFVRVATFPIEGSIRSGNVSMNGTQFSRIEPRFVLRRSETDAQLTPLMTRWEIRAVPVKGRNSRWTLPILNREEVEIDGVKYVRDPLVVLDALLELVQGGNIFTLQESNRAYQVHGKDFLWIPDSLTTSGRAWQGTFVLVVEEVA